MNSLSARINRVATASPRRVAVGCALLVMLAPLAGCGRTKPQVVQAKPPEVNYAYPRLDNVREYEDFTGRTESIPTVEVRARVTSQLEKVHFKDGDDVKKGDPLFDLDSRQYDAELERARATQAQSEATLTQKGAALKRARELREKGTNTPEELENAQADFEVARAARDLAIANRRLAEINVSYCHIFAEIGGRLSRKMIDEGNQVTANVTPLTTIVTLNPMFADFDIDERTILGLRARLQTGSLKSIRETRPLLGIGLANEQGFPHTGMFDFSDNRFDSGTGTLRVRVRIDNPDITEVIGPALLHFHDLIRQTTGMVTSDPSKTRLLSPGAFVRVRFYIGEPQPAILVPEAALVSDQGIRHLFLVNEENKVEYRPVEIGLLQGDMREIKSGVTTGDRVIVSGLQRVRAGIEVTASPAPAKKGLATARQASP